MQSKERTNELEDCTIDIIKSESRKKHKEKLQSLRNSQGTIKYTNTNIIQVPEKEREAEILFEK